VFDTLTNPVYDAETAPCMAEVLGIMFAWMGRHKATDAASKDCWGMLAMLLPPDHDLPGFTYAKRILEKHLDGTMETIEMCSCDQIAYIDCTSGPLRGYKHAHRSRCPARGCGLSRYIWVNTSNGRKQLPRKLMYYMPAKHFLQDVFRKAALAPDLRHDSGNHPSGSTRYSQGFHEKIVTNPHMNKESRNQGLILFSDGIPYFKDRGSNRKGYPCGMRLGNLPESLGKKLSMTHLLCLMSCEYWEADPNTGRAKRMLRSPKSLSPMMYRIADELHHLYRVGVPIVDFSMHENNASRLFMLRCILLLWLGDYPGQGEISGFKYSGYRCCHWCTFSILICTISILICTFSILICTFSTL
jgi:hypothetical protein